MSAAVTTQTYRATTSRPLAQTVQQLLAAIDGAIAGGSLNLDQVVGLNVAVAGDRLVRCFTSPDEGVLLLEICDRNPEGDFELFVVPHQDGDLRAGWRRRWGSDGNPPLAWVLIADALCLGSLLQPRIDPDFAVLLACMTSGGPPTISYEDHDARSGLAADVLHLRQIVDRQAAQLRKLQIAATARSGEPTPAVAAEPFERQWRLVDLAEWADLHADSITILPRAIAEAKKSDLENQQLAFDALALLANTYRLVKLSELPREDFKTRADQLGLSIGGAISFPGAHGDAYFVQHSGRRRLLDQHLGRGTSRDSRFSLRIYYFWDEDTKRPVVGWLPSHLPNSMT